MTVIELGEVGTAPAPEQAAPRLDRRLGIAACALLCLFTATGSVVPEAPVRPLWSVPFEETDSSMLAAGTAYVDRATPGGYRLTAYDLATGRVRWETAFEGEIGYTRIAAADGLVLLPAGQRLVPPDPDSGDSGYVSYVTATVAVEAATGRQLWRVPGDVQYVYRGTALMYEYSDQGGLAEMRLMRLADRAIVWHLPAAGVYVQTVATAGDRPDKIVTAGRDGRVDVYRYADGVRLNTGRVAWTTPQPRQDEFSDISVAGDYLVVNRNRRGQADVHVYRLDTLAEVWHAANPNGWAFGCGPALCLAGGTDLVAYDLATGRRRWQRDGVTAGGPVRDDRVIADDGGHPLLLDAATGHQIGERGDGITVWTVEPSTALYLLRSTRTPPGRTSVTRWDVATGRTRLLGAVDPVPGERCQVLGHHLACIADRAFKVIELP